MNPHALDQAVELGRGALFLAMELLLPVLLAGLVIGILTAVLQAATQVHEQAIGTIPRLAVIVLVLALVLPWMLSSLSDYARELIAGAPQWVK